MKEFSSTEINEYFLVDETDTYHVLFNRDMGSCSCKGFIYNTGAAALPCEHLMKVRMVEAGGTDLEKPTEHLLDIIKAMGKGGAPPAPPKEGKTTYICKDCGKQTNKQQAEKSFDELGYIQCSDCYNKTPGEEKPPQKPKKKDEKLPAKQEPGKSTAKKKTDTEIEDTINLAKAKKIAKGGEIYKARGKETVDAKLAQQMSNEHGISIDVVRTVQTDDYAEVVVRASLGDVHIDAVVHHDFKVEFMLKTLEIVAGNPEILDHWEGMEPVIKEGAKIKINEYGRDTFKDAKYFIVHTLLSFKKFSIRDARSKATRIAELALLNQDFRDEDEQRSEEDEKKLVQESIDNRQAMKAEA